MNRRELLKFVGVALGGSVSAAVANAVLASDTALPATKTPALAWPHIDIVSPICELIIPTTDTPGAISAGVPAFAQLIYQSWYNDAERQAFDSGVAALDVQARKDHGAAFENCSEAQQVGLLELAEGAGEHSALGGFFRTMKELTVVGYYTSEVGAKQELVYNPFPVKYKGDYLYSDIGRQWSY